MQRDSALARMSRNIAWGLGSRGFNSVAGIAYLALAARTLGPKSFGEFVLILTYGQLIANFVQFQSWKGVIRYGSLHLADKQPDRLHRLFGYTATLDVGSALFGALIAAVGAPIVAPLFHWTPHQQMSAALFGTVLLLTTGATATGMLRLFNRFDLVAYAEAVGPLVRLGGCVIAWLAGGHIDAFLVIWGAAGVAQAAVQWVAALLAGKARLAVGPTHFRRGAEENEGIWRFMVQTNISNSISTFWLQLGTMAVGAVAGAADAGAFRLAQRLAKGIVRPVRPITIALYPELARMVANKNHSELRKMVLHATVAASGIAVLVVLVTSVAGREILSLLAGKNFEFAYVYLLLLSVATALDLAGIAFEPLQDANGRAGTVLRARSVAAVAYAILLATLLPWLGGQGAAIAAIVCSALIFVQLARASATILKDVPGPAAVPARGQAERTSVT
ncbi:lipopolysaccharide biosynthesis protein [Sphingomonas sp. BN140010]|uniref:Lipopolysaccharide biosynthesis protein n=1 Tax=Sphingomonas arvum TaxID=2992113 RepID=A0ABT3JD42_9SPHN|nr:lipopolysaccharide biosynthesis protein [Sphingomonas sp. BN140010]MCW3796985.1 lipopolysaccharide biosynthesis protein [Sphingomonas sp. BN140010]